MSIPIGHGSCWRLLLGWLLLWVAMPVAALAAGTQTDLDAAEYHVFLVAGQSNAQGYLGPNDEGLNEPIPVPAPGTTFYFNDKTAQITDVVNAPKADYVGSAGGFHNSFAIAYRKATGKKIIFIHEVHGNSGIVAGVVYGGGNWPDTYRAAMKAKYDAFKTSAAPGPMAGKWQLAGLIWGQGEAEQFLLEQKKKTLQELEGALSGLFDGFVQDYGADFHGKPDVMIKVVLVSIFAYPNMQSDRFYPDSPDWAATRDMQRHVSATHPAARMVYFATEKFFNEKVWPNNAVHYYQKQYNGMGRVMGQEIAKPCSTIAQPTAPQKLLATGAGAWRIDLKWNAPQGGVPGDLPCYRIYRRDKGQSQWTWLWQTSAPPDEAFHDESSIEPATTYEYRVGARNEFGETFGDVASATTAALSKDVIGQYVTLAAPADAAKVKALWQELSSAGQTRGLRSLHLMTASLNSASGKVFNLVRESGPGEGRFDFADPGKTPIKRTAAGYEFNAPAEAALPGPLLPTNGPFTLLFKLTWLRLPQGNEQFAFMSQGRGAPTPPEQSRSIFFLDTETGLANFYHEDQTQMFKCGGARVETGRADIFALTYNGRDLTWRRSGSPAVTHDNTIYFLNMQDVPFVVHSTPSGSPGLGFRLSYAAVWNRSLDAAEFDAAVKLIDQCITRGN